MQIPLQITFRDMEPSAAVETIVREKAEKLDRFADIMSCNVVIEMINKHQHKGTMYKVTLDITLPGGEIAVSRDRGLDHSHEDIYVALRDSFDAARRQLQDYQRKKHQKVKSHEVPPHGRVAEIFPEMGYGTIETPDGREIYFHENSVLNGELSQLEEGNEVRFAEEQGEKGPQASSVQLIGKHHIVG
ncbi:MAG: HPF/RaiA family ribosome-associated protein [Gammaproteobacteria bacterium]|jgi:ribosomal subunit interface protein